MSTHDASDLSPNGTPWKLRGFWPDRSRLFFGARLCKFQDFPRFLLFILWICLFSNFILGGSRRTSDDPGSIQRPLRISRDHLGGNLWWSDFSRNPKITKINCWMFPVPIFNDNQRNRCRINARLLSSHRITKKNDFHDFWKYWKVASSQIASKMVPGDPQWSLDAP